MPYTYYEEKRNGKTFYCIKSKRSGKTACYLSKDARQKGERLREAAAHLSKAQFKKAFRIAK
ncbi:hypothetical protein KAW50_02565 [candidate division WOR-3 bacterium]|nr:hypothetical protein [candidate division WOR-3 bacterium]